MKTKLSISIKIISFSALLLVLINFSQFFFVRTVFRSIIEEEKEFQFNEKVNIVFQTLEQGERSLIGTLDALNYSDDISATQQFLWNASSIEGETSAQQEKRFRELFQNDAVENLEKAYYGDDNDSVVPFILNADGSIIMHKDLNRGSMELGQKDYVRKVLDLKNGSLDYRDDGEEYWIVFRTFDSWGWTVCYTISFSEKYSAVNSFRDRYIPILLAGLIIFLVLIFISLRTLLKPLKRVESKIREISSGEGDLTQEVEIHSSDEVGKLATSFNSFISQLKVIVINIKKAASTTLKIKDDLGGNMMETVTVLEEISGNMSNMEGHINKLDENISTSVSAVGQIEKNISQLNDQMQEQSSMVRETSASVTQMISSIDNVSRITKVKSQSSEQLLATSEKGGEQLRRTGNIFRNEIGANVDKIGEMVAVISSISSKTNLLAMNAAIEAAHAGQSGLGFAVVADEIRKLAEESNRQVKEIKESIKGIISGIEQTERSMGETDSAFAVIGSEIREVVSALSEIFASTEELSIGGQQILEAMTSLNDITVHISTGSEEMLRGSADVNSAMNDVKRISHEVANGMREVVVNTEGVNRAMSSISRLSEDLGASSERLGNEINRFKTD
ncbi:methyl-accepting chemotaxis protein [Spirochaeta isovalerica]|uniref:Methyl-accepting chemotaxis protein n=1 Tax=Spirochaeta isovalerica TaxID=150 RepID=A0A841R1T0_9SPIO|nr:methyl-accepting chemotaxis protein [Spirochaeta isovalerica]MBB6478964.1 methyl-accepting chemotaxis protein [Spirochaeta isovalerica]